MPQYSFRLNGKDVQVDAPANLPALWALREKLGTTGPKYGCGIDVCKACTSHLDGKKFNPCNVPTGDLAGREVTTIEGLANLDDNLRPVVRQGGVLHTVQEAWLEIDVAQCGYCQPGQIMAAAALLATNKNPTDDDIDGILNVCRCGTYVRIRQAIKLAASRMK
jgi:isoquinoline 1-oxidoreductase alpha subunit